MGRVTVECTIANAFDVHAVQAGRLKPGEVRNVRIEATVDSGANQLVLPQTTVEQLGLTSIRDVTVTYGDRRQDTRSLVTGARVELCGRMGIYQAVVEPRRTTALIGAIVLQDLDLLIDCKNHAVIPRDPEVQITEIE